jgi:hypothetical protein
MLDKSEQTQNERSPMKISRTFLLGMTLSLAPLALSKFILPPKALGQMEGTLDFCVQVDSDSAEKYQQRGKALVRDASEKELSDARSTEEYKEAYAWIQAELDKAPREKAVAACKGFLEGK